MARALWLPAVLRSVGLTVHEQPGWSTRGDSNFDPYGVIIHATAGRLSIESDIRVILTGSTTAPPPISQLFLARTGEWWVIASGRCNHALTGTAGNMAGYGNSKLLGIEAANDNRGEAWPQVQYESYVRGVAAICNYVDDAASKRRWTTARVSGHKEHQPGQKSDPTFNMATFRADVEAVLSGNTPQGDDMQADERLWLLNLYNAQFVGGSSMGTPVDAKVNANSQGNAVIDLLQHLRTTVDALAKGGSVALTTEDRTALVSELRGELGAVVREELARLHLALSAPPTP